MWNKILGGFKSLASDEDFNAAIKDAENLNDLGTKLLEWAIPALAKALIAHLSGPVASTAPAAKA